MHSISAIRENQRRKARVMKAKDLKTGFWKESQKIYKSSCRYDEVSDTLFLYFSSRETDRVVAHFVDDYVAFMYRASDNEIIGMQIEYFTKLFMSDEQKIWTLSDTGEKLNGIRNITFVIEAVVDQSELSRKVPHPKIDPCVQLEPVFA